MCGVSAHFFLDHESIQVNSWRLQASTVVGIIDALVLLLLLDFEVILLQFHNLLRGHDLGVSLVILVLNGLHLLRILRFQLFQLDVVHLSDGAQLVSLVSSYALSFEVVANLLVDKLAIFLHNCDVGVHVLVVACGEGLEAFHTESKGLNHILTELFGSLTPKASILVDLPSR